MLTRVRLRKLALAALLRADTDAKKNVYEYDWPTGEEKMPAILFNKEQDFKTSLLRGVPSFTAVAMLTLDVRAMGNTRQDARGGIDRLLDQIEIGLMTDYELRKEVQQFASFESRGNIDSNTGKHIAHYTLDVALEYYEGPERYPAIPVIPLKQVNVNVDVVNRFDANGTYDDAPFPKAIAPAPRTSGPDGRNEGTLVIDNLDE